MKNLNVYIIIKIYKYNLDINKIIKYKNYITLNKNIEYKKRYNFFFTTDID